MSEELRDLLAYAAAGAHCGRGGLLWAGWNAKHWNDRQEGRQFYPKTGAQLVMVTAEAARKLLPKVLGLPNMHMGRMLREHIGEKWQEEIGACFICPPIGGYHQNGRGPP